MVYTVWPWYENDGNHTVSWYIKLRRYFPSNTEVFPHCGTLSPSFFFRNQSSDHWTREAKKPMENIQLWRGRGPCSAKNRNIRLQWNERVRNKAQRAQTKQQIISRFLLLYKDKRPILSFLLFFLYLWSPSLSPSADSLTHSIKSLSALGFRKLENILRLFSIIKRVLTAREEKRMRWEIDFDVSAYVLIYQQTLWEQIRTRRT